MHPCEIIGIAWLNVRGDCVGELVNYESNVADEVNNGDVKALCIDFDIETRQRCLEILDLIGDSRGSEKSKYVVEIADILLNCKRFINVNIDVDNC